MSEHESESALPAIREPDMVRLAEELVASASDRDRVDRRRWPADHADASGVAVRAGGRDGPSPRL